MFRVQDNVPEIYVNKSRDFQLLCRLWEGSWAGVKYNIDSIINSLDPFTIKGEMLELLATKVGFFTEENLDDNVLRYIISSFKYALRYKGSKRGIKIAFMAILNSEHILLEESQVIIDIINKEDKGNNTLVDRYEVVINTPQAIKNTLALREYLKYILPPGYSYTINTFKLSKDNASQYKYSPSIYALKSQNAHTGLVSKYNDGIKVGFKPSIENGVLGNEVLGYQLSMINTNQVLNKKDIKELKSNPNYLNNISNLEDATGGEEQKFKEYK